MLYQHFLPFVLLCSINFLAAQNTFTTLGEVNTQDAAHQIIQTGDGYFLVAGQVGSDAVLYKLDCAGMVIDSLRQDLGGNEAFMDVAGAPGGFFIAVGSTKNGNASSVLITRTDNDLNIVNFDTLKINGKDAEARSMTRGGASWALGGNVAGAGLDFIDGFTTRFNNATLALIGSPAVFSYGVDDVRRVEAANDGGLFVSGGSFVGNIFDPEADLTQTAFVRRTKPDGSLIWEHTYQQTVKAKYGLIYYSDLVRNPFSTNLVAAGRCFGDTVSTFMNACYTLLSPDGAAISSLAIDHAGPENVYATIATPNPDLGLLFLSVGDSVGEYYNVPFIALVAEVDSQLLPLTAVTDQTVGLSVRTVINMGMENAFAGVVYLPGGPALVNQDIFAATPLPLEDALIERFGNTLEATQPEGDSLTYQWYLNDTFIPGANGQTLAINPADVGTYRVVVGSPTGCRAEATYELLVATGEPMTAELRVFPNPFSDKITVEGCPGEPADLWLMDALGQPARLLHADWRGERAKFELKELPAGMYWLETKGKTETEVVVKVIKVH